MKNENENLQDLLSQLSKEEYCYFTTRGRKTGKPHEIEIWYELPTPVDPSER